MQKSLLDDELARFTIWTNMMGVFAGARASMDHRLRETPEVRDAVVDVLEGLLEHIETCMLPLFFEFLIHLACSSALMLRNV